MFCIGSAILAVPATLLETNRQNAWFCGVLAIGFALLIVAVLLWVIQRYPQQTFIQIAKKALGRYAGTCISLIYIFLHVHSIYVFASRHQYIYDDSNCPEANAAYVDSCACSFSCYIRRYLGIEVVGRTAEIFLPWIVVPFFIVNCFKYSSNGN